jgi:L-iditol 2-dehydrogenase
VKAAAITGPGRIELLEVPVPACPDDGVLLAVRACGICGSDLRRWREGPDSRGRVIAGHEFSGVIAEVGSRVSDYHVGERLAVAPDVHCLSCWYCRVGRYNLCDDQRQVGITPGYDGGLAEVAVLPGDVLSGGVVHHMPASLSFVEGALAEPLSSVQACHQDVGTAPGETVLVMGAGPIGCLHMAVAHLRGARVILSEPNEQRRGMALPFVPDLVLDPGSQDIVAEVKAFTDGLGADVAICANPVAATHQQAVGAVRKRGTVVLFGGLRKAAPMTSLDANRIHYDEIRIIGSFSYHPEDHARALRLLERGQVDSAQVVTHTFPLDEVEAAFGAVAAGEALKVMVTVERSAGGGR